MVQVPLIVDAESGVNDMLDRDGSRTPVAVPHRQRPRRAPDRRAGRAGRDEVEAAGAAAVRHGSGGGPVHRHAGRAQGLLPRPRPQRLRRPVGLGARDHRRPAQPRLPQGHRAPDLVGAARRRDARPASCSRSCVDDRYPDLPEEITFIHAEDLLARYPDLPRKQRETGSSRSIPAVFIIGIGWTLDDGYPHEMRAADYDDWVTPTATAGRPVRRTASTATSWSGTR